MPSARAPSVLFVYGTLLRGEVEHALLGGSEFLGPVRTAARYLLVDLGRYPALVAGGRVAVVGELYRVDAETRFRLDVHHECPVLFHRFAVTLDDERTAEAYAMREEQVRGKRRLKLGSWRDRFAPSPRATAGGPLVEYLKRRHSGV